MSIIESALAKLRRGELQRGAETGPAGVPMLGVDVVPGTRPLAVQRVEQPSTRIAVDTDALRTAGYLPEEGLERRFADHYRQIKRPLIERAQGAADMRLILVTSALPGDGKTFTSINLALSIARERDVSVLLVDADVLKQHVSDVFGLHQERGLLDALVDESLDPESLVVKTGIRGFEILPAGRHVEHAAELFASARMTQIAARLGAASPRRVVLIDSAPILVSSETSVLLRIAGQIVVVVRAGVTPYRAVLNLVDQLDKEKPLGLVLNDAPKDDNSAHYGYDSYYTYGRSTSMPGKNENSASD